MKKGNSNSKIGPLDDYVKMYEPAQSFNDMMGIAEEFVRTHPKEIIIFASSQVAAGDLAKKLGTTLHLEH